MAALLRKSRAADRLLPLLAEPAASALQGVSILARHGRPHYVLAYLQVKY